MVIDDSYVNYNNLLYTYIRMWYPPYSLYFTFDHDILWEIENYMLIITSLKET